MEETKRISDEAVLRATGKKLAEWFALLDKVGAKTMTHTEIASWLYDNELPKHWWCQMVTVSYEQARGLRKVHERPDGYSMSVSKTVDLPLAELYQLWADPKKRQAFLKEPLEVTSQTKNKYLRGKWSDDSRIEIGFYAKGDAKSQIALQQNKIKDEKTLERMRTFWKNVLEKMKGEV